MTVLEYVENQIVKLKDDLQHYTMVEKDSALASQIRYDLEQFETIEKELKALEIIRKKHIHKCVLDTFEQDFNLIEIKGKDITQEEYDLLKEVLL